jgi:hypothetical protein
MSASSASAPAAYAIAHGSTLLWGRAFRAAFFGAAPAVLCGAGLSLFAPPASREWGVVRLVCVCLVVIFWYTVSLLLKACSVGERPPKRGRRRRVLEFCAVPRVPMLAHACAEALLLAICLFLLRTLGVSTFGARRAEAVGGSLGALAASVLGVWSWWARAAEGAAPLDSVPAAWPRPRGVWCTAVGDGSGCRCSARHRELEVALLAGLRDACVVAIRGVAVAALTLPFALRTLTRKQASERAWGTVKSTSGTNLGFTFVEKPIEATSVMLSLWQQTFAKYAPALLVGVGVAALAHAVTAVLLSRSLTARPSLPNKNDRDWRNSRFNQKILCKDGIFGAPLKQHSQRGTDACPIVKISAPAAVNALVAGGDRNARTAEFSVHDLVNVSLRLASPRSLAAYLISFDAKGLADAGRPAETGGLGFHSAKEWKSTYNGGLSEPARPPKGGSQTPGFCVVFSPPPWRALPSAVTALVSSDPVFFKLPAPKKPRVDKVPAGLPLPALPVRVV